MRRYLSPFLGSALFLGFILLLDVQEVGRVLLSADILNVFIGFLFGVLTNLVTVFRWKMILNLNQKNFSYLWLLKVFGQGLSLNCVLPGGIVSGDVYRSYSVSKKLIKGDKFIGPKSVLIDRFSGVWSVSVLSLLSTFLIFLYAQHAMSKEILIYYTFLLIGITLAPLIFNRYIQLFNYGY